MNSSSTPPPTSHGLDTPRPQVLSSMTDGHLLAVLRDAAEPLSRAEIAAQTGLSKPAIGASAVRLLERGLLREAGTREGRRGGVATLLQIDPQHGHSLGISIQNDGVAVRAMDIAGNALGEWGHSVGEDATTADIIRVTNDLIGQAGPGTPLLAAAVSFAHAVDSQTGKPVVVPRSATQHVVFDPITELELGTAGWVRVDNDVNWATLAESQQEHLLGCRDFVYVYFGVGIGAGLFLDGRLFRGARGLAGEVGYLRDGVDRSKDLTERLAELGLGAAGRYGLDLDAAAAMFGGGPLRPAAEAVIDAVAVGLENIAVTLDPQVITLGGPLASHPAFFDALADRVAQFSSHSPRVERSTSTPLDGACITAHEHALDLAGIPPKRNDP